MNENDKNSARSLKKDRPPSRSKYYLSLIVLAVLSTRLISCMAEPVAVDDQKDPDNSGLIFDENLMDASKCNQEPVGTNPADDRERSRVEREAGENEEFYRRIDEKDQKNLEIVLQQIEEEVAKGEVLCKIVVTPGFRYGSLAANSSCNPEILSQGELTLFLEIATAKLNGGMPRVGDEFIVLRIKDDFRIIVNRIEDDVNGTERGDAESYSTRCSALREHPSYKTHLETINAYRLDFTPYIVYFVDFTDFAVTK